MGSEGLSGFWWSKCDIYVTVDYFNDHAVNVTYTSCELKIKISCYPWSKCDIYVTIEIHSGNVVNVTYTSWFTITGVMP